MVNHALTSATLWWDALVTCGGASRRACRCHDQRRARAQTRAEAPADARAQALGRRGRRHTLAVRPAGRAHCRRRARHARDRSRSRRAQASGAGFRRARHGGAYRRLRSLSAQRGNPGLPGRRRRLDGPPLPAPPAPPPRPAGPPRRYRLARPPDPEREVIVLNGSREGLFLGAIAARGYVSARAGRPAILVPNPFYAAYSAGAVAADCEVIYLPTTRATGFLPDLDALAPALLARTVAFYLAS